VPKATRKDDAATNRQTAPVDADEVSFVPNDTSDWSGSVDPGTVADALDQLASTGGGGGSSDTYKTVTGDTGSTVASGEDTLNVEGGAGIETTVTSDNVEVAQTSTLFIVGAAGSGGTTVSDKNYEAGTSPASKVLTDFDCDGDSLTIDVEADAGAGATVASGWQPAVTVYGPGGESHAVTLSQIDDTRRFEGTATFSAADQDGTFYATSADGGRSQDVAYDRLEDPPVCSSATWGQYDGGWTGSEYPTSPDTGAQTAVKSGDTIDIQFTLDSSATNIQVTSSGASSSTQNFGGSYSSGTNYIEGVTCGSASGSQVFTIKANRDGGTYGATTNTDSISMDQTDHSYTSVHNHVFSPVDNFALGSGDSCTADVQITNWAAGDYAEYTSSEVSITSDTTYAETKTYTYASGSYRDSGTNVTLTSRRKANGKQDSTTYLIKICNRSPVLTVSGATARLRSRASGGDKTYGITLSCNNELKDTPTLARDAADDGDALPGLSGSEPDKTWTANIAIGEEDTKNTGANSHTWTGISAEDGAGNTVSSITTNPDYTVGGFEERDVAMARFDQYNAIGTMVSNKNNASLLNCEVPEYGKTLTYVGSVTPTTDGFTITDSSGNFDADGDYVRCLDSNIYDAAAYTMRISEDA